MTKWHKTLVANAGLRAGGFLTLCSAVAIGVTLYHQVHAHPVREASAAELGLCTLFVLSLLAGAALPFVGPGLWKQIEVPGRRSIIFDEGRPISSASDQHYNESTKDEVIMSVTVDEAPARCANERWAASFAPHRVTSEA